MEMQLPNDKQLSQSEFESSDKELVSAIALLSRHIVSSITHKRQVTTTYWCINLK